MPLGSVRLLDNARTRYESVLCVLGADAAFYGMSALEEVFLAETQLLAGRHAQLLLYQVNAHDLLGDGMLNLQTGVHFKEIKVAVFVNQKLNGACSAVVYGLGGCNGLLAHLAPKAPA